VASEQSLHEVDGPSGGGCHGCVVQVGSVFVVHDCFGELEEPLLLVQNGVHVVGCEFLQLFVRGGGLSFHWLLIHRQVSSRALIIWWYLRRHGQLVFVRSRKRWFFHGNRAACLLSESFRLVDLVGLGLFPYFSTRIRGARN